MECVKTFTFLDYKTGVNKDGEKYVAMNVRDKETKKNYNFLCIDVDIVDKIVNSKLIDYQDIKLKVLFDRVFNRNTRYSNWQASIVDIFGNGVVANGN